MFMSIDFSYKDLQSSRYTFIPLSHISDIVSGIFTRFSKTFVLNPYKCEPIISIGYSRCLREDVKLESDIVMPFLTNSMEIAFSGPDFETVKKGIILFKEKDIDKDTQTINAPFLNTHPCLTNYIELITSNNTRCCGEGIGSVLNILNYKQSKVFTQSKHILAIKGKECHSFYDESARYAIPKEMYGIHVKGNTLPPKVFTAIFNSALFCCLRFHNEMSSNKIRYSKFESLRDFPVPAYSPNQALIVALDRIVDCLIWGKKQIAKNMPTNRLERYLYQMLDMIVFELYLSDYLQEKSLSLSKDLYESPLVSEGFSASEDVFEVYHWFMSANNKVRQKIMLLDSRSSELLYPMFKFLTR